MGPLRPPISGAPLDVRSRRSVLYMPGSNARALAKAKSLPADALTFDLEDAGTPNVKASARDQVCAAVREGGYGPREIIVRVNALAPAWGQADLAAVGTAGALAVLIPKVESAHPVRRALAVLDDAGGPSDLPIWCTMETPRAMLSAEKIAGADPRVGYLVMGTSDLAEELHAAHTPERLPLITGREGRADLRQAPHAGARGAPRAAAPSAGRKRA